jgi:1,4-dihydroxy-2-naphthoyl-CoA hydrolase
MTGPLDAAGLARLVALMPFAAVLGLTLDAAAPEEARGHIAWDASRCTAGGLLHGGVLMAVADSVGAVVAFLNLPPGATTSTIESKTNFFRGVREGTLHAVSRPLHVGRSTIAVLTDLTDGAGRLVGHTTQTQAVLAARE